MNERMVKCDCGTHSLQVQYDEEGQMFYVSLWEDRRYANLPWTERWRHIWYILRTGHPYSDEVIVTLPEADQLAMFLTTRGGTR